MIEIQQDLRSNTFSIHGVPMSILMQHTPDAIVREIAERVAEVYIQENKTKLMEAIDPATLNSLTVDKISTELKNNLYDKIKKVI